MNNEREQAYSVGLKLGTNIMAGHVGSTRFYGENGKFYLDDASLLASYLDISDGEMHEIITAFHQERLDAEPDLTVYPELRGQRDLLLERYRGMRDAGMSDVLVAIVESLQFWRGYRMRFQFGKTYIPPVVDPKREKCRVVYLPESDQGALHFKNVDDPIVSWQPRPPEPKDAKWTHSPLFFDGVGSGLHIDEEPKEIFPADPRSMAMKLCSTVDEVREFMVRYNYFWNSANLLVHDDKGNSVAFDKASRNRIAVREPQPNGMNYVNGMSSFDDDYQDFIRGQRKLYLQESGQDDQSVEACFFNFCEGVLRNMKRYMKALAEEPTADHLIEVMTSHDADGALCKTGGKVHPDEKIAGYTLVQSLFFLDKKIQWRRQWRGDTPVWEDPWEVIQYVSS